MLFAGKSDKSSVTHQINDLDHIITEGEKAVESKHIDSPFDKLQLIQFSAQVPESPVKTEALSLEIYLVEWIALYGEAT